MPSDLTVATPSAAEQRASTVAPITTLRPTSNDAAVAIALMLDLRLTVDALHATLTREADGNAFYEGHYDVSAIKSVINRLIGARVA